MRQRKGCRKDMLLCAFEFVAPVRCKEGGRPEGRNTWDTPQRLSVKQFSLDLNILKHSISKASRPSCGSCQTVLLVLLWAAMEFCESG